MNIDEKIRKLKKELKIPPNIKEWGKHIKNLCDKGLMEKAHGCIKDMMRHGMEPNVTTFTTLLLSLNPIRFHALTEKFAYDCDASKPCNVNPR